jgi:hypothetical protein
MTPTEARALRPGDLVRALIPVMGGVDLGHEGEMEISLPAGAVATVHRVEQLGERQGWAVHLSFDNGIDNTFDEGDADAFALERVEDTPAERRARAAFLIQHSPPDYPMAELARDLHALFEAPKAATIAEPQPYRVMMRGMVTGTLVVQAVSEDQALAKAEAWTRRSYPEATDLEDYGDCNNWEVEGLE